MVVVLCCCRPFYYAWTRGSQLGTEGNDRGRLPLGLLNNGATWTSSRLHILFVVQKDLMWRGRWSREKQRCQLSLRKASLGECLWPGWNETHERKKGRREECIPTLHSPLSLFKIYAPMVQGLSFMSHLLVIITRYTVMKVIITWDLPKFLTSAF